jgi:dienelactone hydrolase
LQRRSSQTPPREKIEVKILPVGIIMGTQENHFLACRRQSPMKVTYAFAHQHLIAICSHLAGAVTVALVVSCVTASGPKENPDLTIPESPGQEKPLITPSRAASGLAPWTLGGKPQKVAWFLCAAPEGRETVVFTHSEKAGFVQEKFCNLPDSQAFMASGFHILGVNRPGFAPSTGEADLIGKSSQQAMLVAVKHAAGQAPGLPGPIAGAYGFGTGAAAAAFFAKQKGGLAWLMVGAGIYDFEQAARISGDKDLIAKIEKSVAKEGDVAYEIRSIGYDVTGLPPRIAIFQGQMDSVAPAEQSMAFRDSLAASEYKVTFQMISGIGHDLTESQMRQVLDMIIPSIKK